MTTLRCALQTFLLLFLVAALAAADPASDLVNAARKGQIEKVRGLLAKGVSPDVTDKQKRSALTLAFEGSQFDVARLLLQAGAQTRDAIGPLADFVLVWAVEEKRTEIAAAMRTKGARAMNTHGTAALQRVIDRSDPTLVEVLLLDGAAPSGRALRAASKKGYLDAVRALLDRGADVNEQGPSSIFALTGGGYSVTYAPDGGPDALMIAIDNGQLAVVRALLEKGADPSRMMVYEGASPLPSHSPTPDISITSLALAAVRNRRDILEPMLDRMLTPSPVLALPLIAAALGKHLESLAVLVPKASGDQKMLALG